MKTITALLFILLLSACSNSSDVSERPDSRSGMKGGETMQERTDTDVNNLNQNIIRQRTETTFRGINKQEGPGLKPPGSLPTNDNSEPENKE